MAVCRVKIRVSKGCLGNTYDSSVPPIRSGFPDHGPDPDFFEEIGPDLG